MTSVNTATRAVDRLTEATNALNDPAVFHAARHLGVADELAEIVWRVGNLAAQIDPVQDMAAHAAYEQNPFGNATERGE